MKIAIFGSYNGGSIGDTAILLGLISSIFRILGDDVEISVLALGNLEINNELEELGQERKVKEVAIYRKFDNSIYGFGKVLNKGWRFLNRLNDRAPINEIRIRKILKTSDVLLIGGGNLVMDIYSNWPKILRLVCDLSIDECVPYSFVGVGSAPINTSQGKNDLLYSLNSAEDVYFRDSTSKSYCEDHLGFDRSLVGPDLAFGINSPHLFQADKENILMLNLAAVFSGRWPVTDLEKYNNYLSSMVFVVDKLCEKLDIKEVVIFNTNYPLDEFAGEEFIEIYKNFSKCSVSLRFMRGRETVSSLLNACSKAKFSLVTRLHAGIISRISGAHVFAIEYQPKVRDVLGSQTSHTVVESFDAVLSGSAFDSVAQIDTQNVSHENYIDYKDVDKLVSLVLKSPLSE